METRENNLQTIREAVMRAADPTRWQRSPDIHISDVLLAMLANPPRFLVPGYISGDRMNAHETNVMEICARWNLHDDRLEALKDEDLQLLVDLLAK